jgi:hypothetical protein
MSVVGGHPLSLAELHDAVLAVDGIAAAEIAPRSDRGPAVRVWLDGSREASSVSAEVDRLLESAGYRTPKSPKPMSSSSTRSTVAAPPGNGSARRTGLGRGLEALIPAPDPDMGSRSNRLEMVAVEESSAGTEVRAVDGAGRSARATVRTEKSLNAAVAETVADLLGFGAPPAVSAVEVHQLGGVSVLVVVIEVDGRRASGSAVIESGMPFALGTALWSALRSVG